MPRNRISSLSKTSCSDPDESESLIGATSGTFYFLKFMNSKSTHFIGFNFMCCRRGDVFSESRVDVDDFLEFIK
jgi:hypothetical protein